MNEQLRLFLKMVMRSKVSGTGCRDWSVERFSPTDMSSVIADVNKKSTTTQGCKYSFNSFKYRWLSQCNGVPSDRSILKFKLGNIIQDHKTIDTRQRKYNDSDLTI
jgi:hypothetical protein